MTREAERAKTGAVLAERHENLMQQLREIASEGVGSVGLRVINDFKDSEEAYYLYAASNAQFGNVPMGGDVVVLEPEDVKTEEKDTEENTNEDDELKEGITARDNGELIESILIRGIIDRQISDRIVTIPGYAEAHTKVAEIVEQMWDARRQGMLGEYEGAVHEAVSKDLGIVVNEAISSF